MFPVERLMGKTKFLNLYREIRKFFTFQARIRGYTMNNHSVQILGVRA